MGGGQGWRVREEVGERGRNDPNIVCTYEFKKNLKKIYGMSMNPVEHHSLFQYKMFFFGGVVQGAGGLVEECCAFWIMFYP
jgi:hypothetical protein